ncbi:CyP450 monooxygenase [Lenzites betulinus]|nr:CyP450 monooxygenase [Lenzites betulinus]
MALIAGTSISVLDIAAVSFALIVFLALRKRSRIPIPPGPPGLPLLGNALDIPVTQSWLVYRELAYKYGDVMALQAFGQTVVVLSSLAAAEDLFDKRSGIYSDRPESTLAVLYVSCRYDPHIIGWDWNLAFKRYDNSWRNVRRMFWKHFQPGAVTKFQQEQQHEARQSLERLLDNQSDLDGSIKLALTKTILTTVHGIPSEEATSHYVDMLTASEEGVAEAFTPGAFLVEFMPWLQHVPSWMPGTGWQKRVIEWRGQSSVIRDELFDAAWDARRRGVMKTSILSELLENMLPKGAKGAQEQLKDIKETTAVAFGAGADTTAATLVAFFCAMILFPEVQKRAQAELDAVIGPDRMPEHADRAALPYLNAMVKELLRWHTVGPMGVSHRCMEEDVYRGWRIPKGAIVVVNAWSILHDPEMYPEPEAFRPERFLDPNSDVLDPTIVAFGFGRRICPGRHFAEDSLFINMASVLHVFNILPALDERGKPIPVESTMTSGFLSYQEEFKYSIKPRSAAAEELIRGERGNTA